MQKRVNYLCSLTLGTVLFITTLGYTLKYYNEWAGESDWSAVQSFSNAVSFNCNASAGSKRSEAQAKINKAASMGFTVIGGANAPLDMAGIDGAIADFYDTVNGHPAVKFAYFYDEPWLHGGQAQMTVEQTAEVVRTYCDRYKAEGERRGVNIPGFISYDGAGEARALGGVPDSLAIPGMFTYFAPTISAADAAQFAKYENKVRADIKDLKAMAGTRPLMVIGQSFDEGTGMPSAGQQRWYIDDVRNDPQILVFMWFHYGETLKYSELINAHSQFGRDLINIGVHNVSVSTGTAGTTAIIKWQTNLPCDSGTVEYGTSESYGSTVQDTAPDKPDGHTATISNLTPGQTIFYKITSRKANYTEGPYSSWFGMGAGGLTGMVQDEVGKTMSSVRISLNPTGLYAITDNLGKYTIKNIAPGNYMATAQIGNDRVSSNVTITNAVEQTVNFTFPGILMGSSLVTSFRNGNFETGDLSGWIDLGGIDSKAIRSGGNFGVYPYGGTYYVGQIVNGGAAEGMMVQRFKTTPTSQVTANAWVYTNSFDGAYPDRKYPTNNYVQIGLDPTGGTNSSSPNVTWTAIENGRPFESWGKVSVTVTAQGSVMSIYFHLFQSNPLSLPKIWNMTGIDEITIEQTAVNDTTAPTLPVAKLPTEGTSVTAFPLIIDWTDSTDALSIPIKYELQIDNEINFNAPITIEKKWNDSVPLYKSSWTVTSLSKGTYYWRVRAADSASTPNFSAWTAALSFIVTVVTDDKTPPSVPTITAPAAGSNLNTSRPTFTWQASIDDSPPIFYDIQVAMDNTFSVVSLNPTNVTGTQYTPTNSLAGGTYYWRMRASDSATTINVSSWSAGVSFTITGTGGDTTPPDVPILSSPLNNIFIQTSRPVFDWTDVSDTESLPVKYEIEVDNDSTFSTPELKQADLTESQFTATLSLANGLYYWRVRASDNVGNNSNWTSSWSVTINSNTKELKSGEVRAVLLSPAKPGTLSPSKNESVKLSFKNKSTTLSIGRYELKVLDTMGNVVHTDKTDASTEGEFTWKPGKTLPPGVYVTYIEGPGVKSYDKLIVGK